MGIRAAVAGASGYAGSELVRLLTQHPDIEPAILTARSDTTPETLREADVVFLALPHGLRLDVDAPLVVDLSSDHRHEDGWVYGLPELHRAALAGATRIAVPGCYVTAVTLALAPFMPAEDIVVVAASGYTGAGRGGPTPDNDLSAYKVGVHQHMPEIATNLGVERLSFTTVLAPMPRVILATCTARTPTSDLRSALAYENEPFVHLLPEGEWPHSEATVGTNECHLQVTTDGDRVVVVSAIDNLGKGAAGQAIQCANIALGLPETAGLVP